MFRTLCSVQVHGQRAIRRTWNTTTRDSYGTNYSLPMKREWKNFRAKKGRNLCIGIGREKIHFTTVWTDVRSRPEPCSPQFHVCAESCRGLRGSAADTDVGPPRGLNRFANFTEVHGPSINAEACP